MYNSQYYTCEQIDQRLLQGYVDDFNSHTSQSLTKAQFLAKLAEVFSPTFFSDYFTKSEINNILDVILTNGFTYGGVATPNGTPYLGGDGDDNYQSQLFFIATQPGTYTNYGGTVIPNYGFYIILWDTDTWSFNTIFTYANIGYFECNTAAATAEKTVTASGYMLTIGGAFKIKMVNANTANNVTLNINSQGAKALYYQGERASATNSWDDNEVVEIYYDGTSYYANNVKGGSGSGVYDVSKEHPTSGPNSDGKFTLEYILNSSNVNDLIPVNKRYPGMSIQFVSTSDNKYVQYRLMSNSFNTTPANWQGVDDEPTADSHNLVESGGVAQEIEKILIPTIIPISGGFIDKGNGNLTAYTTDPAYYSDFIPINNDAIMFYSGEALYAVCQWAFYDKNKVFISSYRSGTSEVSNILVDDIPNNAFYIRFSSIYVEFSVNVISRKKLYELHLTNAQEITENAQRILANSQRMDGIQNEFDILFSKPTFDLTGYYNIGNGSFSSFASAKSTSTFYPISEFIDYIITAYTNYSSALFVLYDEQKNVLSTFPTSTQGQSVVNKSFRELANIPSNAKYIRFSALFPDDYAPSVKASFISSKIWSNKKWAVIGDSLTEHNSRAIKNYHDYVAEATGISVVNLGSSGTGYAKDGTSNFLLRINSVPTDSDVITIFGSGNDLGFLPLGEITDSSTTTLCGYINATIDAVLAKFPLTPFGIITPTPWFDSWTPESAPNSMSNYADAIAGICKKRGIPCLNLFYSSNLHPEIPAIRAIEYKRDGTYEASTQGTPNAIQVTSEMLSYIQSNGVPNAQVGDWVLGTLSGVHPDEDGHKLIAAQFEAFLKTLLLN